MNHRTGLDTTRRTEEGGTVLVARVMPDPATEPTITAERAAVVVGVSRTAAYDAIARGDWPAIRVGRSLRIPTARWLRAIGLLDEQPTVI